jgi:anthranilate/para-aminobenzoate synthase component II
MPTLQALIEKWYRQKPILGICLGFQAIAYFFGGKIDKGMPHHGKVERVKQMHPNQLFHQCPEEFNVVRYHSLLVSSLGKPLVPTLFAKNGELMAFEHESLPISGLQFHPEAHLSEFGLQIFANWLGV